MDKKEILTTMLYHNYSNTSVALQTHHEMKQFWKISILNSNQRYEHNTEKMAIFKIISLEFNQLSGNYSFSENTAEIMRCTGLVKNKLLISGGHDKLPISGLWSAIYSS